jgi:hypothetical protein
MKITKFYKEFKSRRMTKSEIVLCDTEFKMPMIYNGVKNAEKAAEKHNGLIYRMPMQMNKYYVIQK